MVNAAAAKTVAKPFVFMIHPTVETRRVTRVIAAGQGSHIG